MMRQELPSDPLSWLRDSGDVIPTPGAEARVAARLAALAAPVALAPATSGSAPPAAAPATSSGNLKMLAERFVRWSLVPLGLGVGLGAGMQAGIDAARGGEQLQPQPTGPVVLTTPSAVNALKATTESEPPAEVSDAVAPQPAPSASSAAKNTLAAERDLLDHARRQLASNEPARALGFLEHHAQRYPRGQLSEEREAMWVNVLALLGRSGEAKTRGQAFEQRFPRSLMGSSVRAAVRASDDGK